MIILLILAYFLISYYQIRSLAGKKHWRDLVVFSFIMTFSFVVSILYCMGVDLPNPINALHDLCELLGLHY